MGRKLFVMAILVGQLICSCGNGKTKSDLMDQGVITYQLEYLNSEQENPLISLLPSTMDFKFKQHNISLIAEGYLGFFSSRFISKANSEYSNLLIKVLNNKCNYPFPSDEIAFGYEKLPKMEINYSDSTKNIAGFKCQMAQIIFEDHKIPPITVYYTKEINLENPNRNTPFNELNGVLMEFSMKIHNVDTHIKAIQVKPEEVPDSEFQIPQDYRKVTQKEIQNFFLGFK